jgi:two-component system response regulator YesN
MSFRVIIADDEELARYSLRTMISKNMGDVEILCEAENGRVAVQKNRELLPDAVLVDIKMPGLNGIEAAKQMMADNPEVAVLIISAYDNFEYVQTAIDIGVKGYILKPLRQDEVTGKLSVIMHASAARKIYRKEDYSEIRKFIEQELVYAYMLPHQDKTHLQSFKAFLGETSAKGLFLVFSRPADIDAGRLFSSFAEGRRKCFMAGGMSAAVLIPMYVENDSFAEKEGIDAFLRSFFAAEGVSEKLCVGVGSPGEGDSGIAQSYKEALLALRFAVRRGERIVHHGDAGMGESELPGPQGEADSSIEELFFSSIKSGDVESARLFSSEVIQNLSDRYADFEIAKEYVGEFIILTKNALQKLGYPMPRELSPTLLLDLGAIRDQSVLVGWFSGIVESLIGTIREQRIEVQNAAHAKVFNYIYANLFRYDLSLDEISDHTGFSPQYVSRIFRDTMGLPFTEFIAGKRTDFAKYLLYSTDQSVTDVARFVGYLDVNYFCRVFKKATGMTPNDYRRSKRSSPLG